MQLTSYRLEHSLPTATLNNKKGVSVPSIRKIFYFGCGLAFSLSTMASPNSLPEKGGGIYDLRTMTCKRFLSDDLWGPNGQMHDFLAGWLAADRKVQPIYDPEDLSKTWDMYGGLAASCKDLVLPSLRTLVEQVKPAHSQRAIDVSKLSCGDLVELEKHGSDASAVINWAHGYYTRVHGAPPIYNDFSNVYWTVEPYCHANPAERTSTVIKNATWPELAPYLEMKK